MLHSKLVTGAILVPFRGVWGGRPLMYVRIRQGLVAIDARSAGRNGRGVVGRVEHGCHYDGDGHSECGRGLLQTAVYRTKGAYLVSWTRGGRFSPHRHERS